MNVNTLHRDLNVNLDRWLREHANDPEPTYVPPTYPRHRKIRLRANEESS